MKADCVSFCALGSPRIRTVLQPTLQPLEHGHEPFMRGRIKASNRVETRIDGGLQFPQRNVVEGNNLVWIGFGRMKTVIRNGRVGQARKGLSCRRASQLQIDDCRRVLIKPTHGHADKRIRNTWRPSQRVTQQSIQIEDRVKQPPVHVQL